MVCAVHALYLPVSQVWHVLPVDGWYLPTGQSLQAADPAAACWPIAHDVQPTALYVPLAVPTSHGTQSPASVRVAPGIHAGVGKGVGNDVGYPVG